jgi:hypothetical protein
MLPHDTIMRPCARCGAFFPVRPRYLNRTKANYCSHACFIASHGPALARHLDRNVHHEGDCRLWLGEIDKDGYGRLNIAGRSLRVHRLSWELFYGPIPDGLHVCHNCPGGDNRHCVRVTHLFLGTHQDNMDDMRAKGRHAFGTKQGAAKLTPDDVRAIRAAYAQGILMRELARRYGVGKSAIQCAIRRETWRHIE